MIVLSDDPCSFLSAYSARIMYQSYFRDFSWSSLAEVLTTQTYAQRGEIINETVHIYTFIQQCFHEIFSQLWLTFSQQ